MLSAALRQVPLALFFCAMIIGLVPASLQAEDSTAYTLGKYTAYARHCGYHDLATELKSRYGSLEDFKAGRRKHDLQQYDRVRLACGKVEDALEDFLQRVKAAEAK